MYRNVRVIPKQNKKEVPNSHIGDQ